MQTFQRTYGKCNGCPNLIKGTFNGIEYRNCKADVRIPDLCPRLTAKIYAKVKVNKKEKTMPKLNKTKTRFVCTQKEKKTFKNNFNRIMSVKNISGCKLEKMVNRAFTNRSVSQWKNGRMIPTVENLKVLAYALDVAPEYFFNDKISPMKFSHSKKVIRKTKKKAVAKKTVAKKETFFSKLLKLFRKG